QALGGEPPPQLRDDAVDRREIGQRPRRQRPIELAERPCGGQAARPLDLRALELATQQRLEAAQRLARHSVASRVARRQLRLGLGTQTERAADALHVHADHAGALLAARERCDRHPREIAHRPVRSVSQRGSDLGAQGVELIVAELLQAGRVLLVNPVASGSDLAVEEEEQFTYELVLAPVLLSLCERRGERLPEVLLPGPAQLAE